MTYNNSKSRDRGFGYQIYEYNPAYDESKLRPEVKIGATYKIVETIKPDKKSGVYGNGNQYVLCQTTGEILKYGADAVASLIAHGSVINAWVRQKGKKKHNNFDNGNDFEIVVTQLDSIKGKQPNIEQKIVPNKDQTIERLKAFEIIQRYNRKMSLLEDRPQLEFDILKDGSIRLKGLLDTSVEVVRLPYFVRYIKKNQFKRSSISKLYYDNPEGIPQDFQWLFSVQGVKSIEIYMSHPDEIVSTQAMFDSCRDLQTVRFVNFTWKNLKNVDSMFLMCGSLYQVDLGDTQTTSNLTNIESMFHGCLQLRDLKFMENMDVHNVTDARQAFSGCGMIQQIDFSKLNFCNLVQADNMFSECINLTSIKFGKNFSKLVSQTNMLQRCKQLEQIDLQRTNFNSLNDATAMFANDCELKSVSLSSIKFNSLKTLQCAFQSCKKLKSVDLQQTYFPRIELMQEMFRSCSDLKSIKFEPQSLNALIQADKMFNLCSSLESVNFEDLITPRLRTIDELVYKASSLKVLKFNSQIRLLKYIYSMLAEQRVEKLYLPGINLIGISGVNDVEKKAESQKNIKAYLRKRTNKDRQNDDMQETELNNYETQLITTIIGKQSMGLTYIPDIEFNDCIVYRKDIIRSFGYDIK